MRYTGQVSEESHMRTRARFDPARIRQEVAEVAARLLAEGTETDVLDARRKAARQLGVTDPLYLPDFDTVEAAAIAYRELFHDDGHEDDLRGLREAALSMIERLSPLQVELTGTVLSGAAGPDVTVDLVAEELDEKRVAIVLANLGLTYQFEHAGRTTRLLFEAFGTAFRLTLLPAAEWRRLRERRDAAGNRVVADAARLAEMLTV